MFRTLHAPLAGAMLLVPCVAPASAQEDAADHGFRRTYVIRADAAWISPGQRIAPAFVQLSEGRIDWVSTQDRRRESGGLIGGGSKPPIIEVEGTLAPGMVDAWTTLRPAGVRGDRQASPIRRMEDSLPAQVEGESPGLTAAVVGAREAGVAAIYLGMGEGRLRAGVGHAAAFSAWDLPVAAGDAALDCAVGAAATSGPARTFQAEDLKRQFDEAQAWRDSWDEFDEKLEKYEEDLKKYEEKLAEYVEKKKEAEKDGEDGGEKDGEDGGEKDGAGGGDGDGAAAQNGGGNGKGNGKEKGPEMPKRPQRPDPPERNARRDLLLDALDGALPVRVRADALGDLRTLLALQEEHGLDLIVVGGYDADLVAEELAGAGVPVILRALPDHHDPDELRRPLLERFRVLVDAGVDVALASGGGDGAQAMLLARAGALVAQGADPERVWAALTTVPAAILGLEHSHGMLGRGHSGTMILFGGTSPFDASATFQTHKPK